MPPPLTQQQQGLLEQFHRAHAAMNMAVNFEDFTELDACLAANFDPFHHPHPQ